MNIKSNKSRYSSIVDIKLCKVLLSSDNKDAIKCSYDQKTIIEPQVSYLPGIKLAGYTKNVSKENHTMVKYKLIEDSDNTVSTLYTYLADINGVFSRNYLSEILRPKLSTRTTVGGVSRDKGRSILTKLANQFNKGGKKRTAIKNVSSAFKFVNAAIKMDRSIDKFISISNSFRQLWYLNPAFSKVQYPFIPKVLDFVNHATPKFCIKRHLNKGPGRRKRAKKGSPKLRSYLAFLGPHGRRVMSFKWLMLNYYKVDKNYNFKKRLYFFIFNSLMGLEDTSAVSRKIELYKEVVSYLRKRN